LLIFGAHLIFVFSDVNTIVAYDITVLWNAGLPGSSICSKCWRSWGNVCVS